MCKCCREGTEISGGTSDAAYAVWGLQAYTPSPPPSPPPPSPPPPSPPPSPPSPPRSPDSCATDQASLASRINTLDVGATGWGATKFCYDLRQQPCVSTASKICLPEGKTCADYYSVSPASASTPGKHRLCHPVYDNAGSCDA
eukprot:scaffold59771_cov58-Phaeocystis_antarctica.AAC.1